MKVKLFTIYDAKAEYHSPPFCKQATGMALREFSDMAANKELTIGQHPEDFTLFEIGTYDDEHADFEIYPAKRALGCAAEYTTSEPPKMESVK